MLKKLLLVIISGCFMFACSIKAPVTEFSDAKASIDAAKAKGICTCTNQDLLEAVNAYRDAEEMLKKAKKCSPNPVAKSVADKAESVKSDINNTFCSQIDLYEKIRQKLMYAQAKAEAAMKSAEANRILCEQLKSQLADLKSQILAVADDMKVAGMTKELNIMLDKFNEIDDLLKTCDTKSAESILDDITARFNVIKSKLGVKDIVKKAEVKDIFYTVKKGDCLWKISKEQYLNPFMWPLIYWANKTQIKDPDLIYPKQVFKIKKNINAQEKRKAIKHAKTRGIWTLFDEK